MAELTAEGGSKLVLAYSHQIRSSLTIIRGYLSLAEDGDITMGVKTAQKLMKEADELNRVFTSLLKLLRLYQQTQVLWDKYLRQEQRELGVKGVLLDSNPDDLFPVGDYSNER